MKTARTPIVLAALLSAGLAGVPDAPARAGEAVPFTARDGAGLAHDAAAAWAEDARLIYVENDEGLDALGVAERWGYLFYSPGLDACRAYSVREGKIRTATDLGFDFAAPPIPAEWIDSAAALAAAEKEGAGFREKHGGALSTMFLVRGLLHPEDPDLPTWAVVYTSESTSGLWILVDARTGKVVKTWRG